MKIAIVLPAPSTKPIGGYKIMYEYAKYLNLYYNYKIDIFYDINSHLSLHYIKKPIRYFSAKIFKFFKWFDFSNAQINHKVVYNLDMQKLKEYGVIFASSAPVAKKIHLSWLNNPIFYFIQGYEDWSLPKDELIDTYKYKNFHNIVISTWLENILIDNNAKVLKLLPNPIDHDKFYMEKEPNARNPYSIAMMHHSAKNKGSIEGIKALKLVKIKLPEFQATLFSVYPKPDDLPEWIKYIYQPTQEKLRYIYNQNALFLSPSIKEGYGLPPAEAMACGATVITTDSGGVTTFCKNNETAIVVSSPPDPKEISDEIVQLMKDEKLRIGLAFNGNKYIKNFTWENNIKELDSLIKDVSHEKN